MAYGILVHQSGIKPKLPAVKHGILTTRHQGIPSISFFKHMEYSYMSVLMSSSANYKGYINSGLSLVG